MSRHRPERVEPTPQQTQRIHGEGGLIDPMHTEFRGVVDHAAALQAAAEATARKPRHVFRWVFLAVQVLFVVWIIAGAASTSGNCDGKTGDALNACQAGTAAGAAVGIGLIIFLWAAVDVILGITYLVFRRRGR